MAMLIGHTWQVAWHHPGTDLPEAQPRVLAEMFVPARDGEGAVCPAAIRDYARPQGYTIFCLVVTPAPRILPPESLASMRRKRLEARERKRGTMFADEFVARELATRPEYYAGLDMDPGKVEEMARLQARLDYLATYNNTLLEYGKEVVER